MEIQTVRALWFSPTGNAERIAVTAARTLSGQFGVPLDTLSLNRPEARKREYAFTSTDFFVFACPVYAGKLPNKILPDLKACLRGHDTPAAALVTFGNRAFDNALAELVSVLTENGFRVVGAGAVVGEHAFTDKLGGGRPGVTDLWEVRTFAEKTAARFRDASAVRAPGDAAAPYYVPKDTDGRPVNFLKAKPEVNLSRCNGCGACARLCPMGAIDPADVARVPGTCIKCQACVTRCTRRARAFRDPAFLSHVAMLERDFSEPKENAFFYGF
ncbi:MAG: 4Fe-4S binding protein [Oscillibacter sp.]|nr:4Fe-4S binding protein [Oscillibacter sp.]